MKEFQTLIDEYSKDGYSMYSTLIADHSWGDREIAAEYLERFWLPEAEFKADWEDLQNRVFVNGEQGFPGFRFQKGFEMLALRGGCLFEQDDFEHLKRCISNIGDSHFVVVENTFGNQVPGPRFRMKFPAEIKWGELAGGNCVSSIMLEMPHKEYFVYGDSGCWGKYAANEYASPLDMIGFASTYRNLFHDEFRVSDEERVEIQNWLPESFRQGYE